MNVEQCRNIVGAFEPIKFLSYHCLGIFCWPKKVCVWNSPPSSSWISASAIVAVESSPKSETGRYFSRLDRRASSFALISENPFASLFQLNTQNSFIKSGNALGSETVNIGLRSASTTNSYSLPRNWSLIEASCLSSTFWSWEKICLLTLYRIESWFFLAKTDVDLWPGLQMNLYALGRPDVMSRSLYLNRASPWWCVELFLLLQIAKNKFHRR